MHPTGGQVQGQSSAISPAVYPLGSVIARAQGRVARRIEREQNGVPLTATLVAQVDEVAKSLGIVPLSAR